MKGFKRFWILGVCALVLLAGVYATNGFAAEEVTIVGRVYAGAWDENENVTAATIMADTGEEYVIVDNAVGKELFKLDFKVVKASGVIGKDTNGYKTFSVARYETMPE